MSASSGCKRVVIVFFVVSALLAGSAAYWLYDRYTRFADAPLAGIGEDATLVVERGDSLRRVLARLRDDGVEAGRDLEWLALSRQMGADGRIQVGEYALDPGTTPRSLLANMRDGRVIEMGTAEGIFEDPTDEYTKTLLASTLDGTPARTTIDRERGAGA